MDFAEMERTNGVRMSWNVWPTSRIDATRMVVPLGIMYSPLGMGAPNNGGQNDETGMVDQNGNPIQQQPVAVQSVQYDPVVCRSGGGGASCGAYLNPFCPIDFRTKMWTCCLCGYNNPLPPYYAERISEQSLPAEKLYTIYNNKLFTLC
jgi:protein transport protein SEC23